MHFFYFKLAIEVRLYKPQILKKCQEAFIFVNEDKS